MLLAALVLPGPALAEPRTLLLYGDSLMAGYGLAPEEGFAAKLEAALQAAGVEVTVVNASVSGDTAADGAARFDWSVPEMPDAAILGLGANDMLRGLPVAETRANLEILLGRFAEAGVPVLLAGMMADRALGSDYVAAFDALYPELAAAHGADLFPFFLEGVALEADLNQADRIHPNAAGIDRIVANITPFVVDLLARAPEPPDR